MRIAAVWRYPVKSMLGEQVEEVTLRPGGVENDRALALVDESTGLVASAKHPRLWRTLLTYSATVVGGHIMITSPAGWTAVAGSPEAEAALSTALARPVRLVSEPPPNATVERPDPTDVLAHGVEAHVPAETLVLGQGTPGATFVDYAPIHLISSATLEAIGAEQIRYRPNFVIRTAKGTRPFIENDWVGRELQVAGSGDHVVLRISIPTPRCALPTLEHGTLPRDPHAVRSLLTQNRVEVAGFGVQPCAGAYAEVVKPGLVRIGAEVVVR